MSSFSLLAQLSQPRTDRASAPRVGAHFDSIVVAAQAGAEWAWTLLYRSVAGRVLGYLRASGAEDAENLLGEVFLQLARNLPRFSGDEVAFRSWVFTIAHHRVLDDRRRRGRRPGQPVAQVPDRAAAGEDPAAAAVMTADARAALDCLTPRQREVIALRVIADLPINEVSRIVGRPPSAVKALQRRGLATLRQRFLDEGYRHVGARR